MNDTIITDQQTSDQQPYLGQRCFVSGKEFGTIVAVEGQWVRVEIDAQASQWYDRGRVELLPTYPAV